MQHPGIELELLLKTNSMKQIELAVRLDIAVSQVNMLIRGKRSFSADVAVRLEYIFPHLRASYWLQMQMEVELAYARQRYDLLHQPANTSV